MAGKRSRQEQQLRHGEVHERVGFETIYRGIRFKSRLEADVAAALDKTAVPWAYEPCTFAPRVAGSVAWIPDFRIELGGVVMFVEAKPVDLLVPELARQVRRVAVAWETDPLVTVQLLCWKFGCGAELVITGRGGKFTVTTGAEYGVIHKWPLGGIQKADRFIGGETHVKESAHWL